jgi:protein farnesyltransferase subunit beta
MSDEFKLFTAEVDDEGKPTETTEAKKDKDLKIKFLLNKTPEWYLADHLNYLSILIKSCTDVGQKGDREMPSTALYALAPFPILGLDKSDIFPKVAKAITSFLSHRKSKHGGFTKFTEDYPNLVVTMLSIASLAICGTEEAYQVIDKEKTYKMLLTLKNKDGSFSSSVGMENDLRSTYSAIVIASILDILTPELTENVVELVKSCYNYDGGFSPIPHMESHGGYVHCGVGLLHILGHLDDINLSKTVRYIAMRQDPFSGGFNGRTNKLVDSCYTWWIGTAARIIAEHLSIPDFWNVEAMSRYILQCSQVHSGGFRDSPPNQPDPFHTCFALAGLCTIGNGDLIKEKLIELDTLVPVPKEKLEKMRNYFKTH